MPFTFTSMRKYGKSSYAFVFADVFRFNKGDKVLKMEFGDHIGDW